MVKYDIENVKKQINILKNIISVENSIPKNQAENIICDKIYEIKQLDGMNNYDISVGINNNETKKWKQDKKESSLFIKIFYNEIEYVKSQFGLSMTELGFLYELSSYLLYETNLLVDKDGSPINQKRLMELTKCKRTFISGIIKKLENKKCLIRIWNKKECYFIVNPYLMFNGKEINKKIPELFKLIGYKPMN